jgi:hypothetical protein
MNENVKNFIDSVNSQDYSNAQAEFQAAMAQKVSDAFETKKVEIASQMSGSSSSASTAEGHNEDA